MLEVKSLPEGEWRMYLLAYIGESVNACNNYTDAAIDDNRKEMIAYAVAVGGIFGTAAGLLVGVLF